METNTHAAPVTRPELTRRACELMEGTVALS